MASKRYPDNDVEVWDTPLRNPEEPELSLPEGTKEATSKKIDAEEAASALLGEAADIDIGKDGHTSTIVTGIRTVPGSPTTESMVESRIDSYLRAKKLRLDQDLARLRNKYVAPIDTNIKKMQETQRGLNSYALIINAGARSTRNYLQSLKKSRRGKRAGRKAGETTT